VWALLSAPSIAVVGPGEPTRAWPPTARADLGGLGGLGLDRGPLPLSVGVGARLLDWAGFTGERLLWSVGADWASAVEALADVEAILVIADGSARRTVKAPGYIDERAGPYDDSVRRAIASGDLSALRDLDPVLARELMAPGWPALQVLAALAGSDRPHATVHYDDAPYGVGYLVASLRFEA
jgi:hypothetical protein